MLEIYETNERTGELCRIEEMRKGCWINLYSPTEDELSQIELDIGILPSFLSAALDEEEKPHLDSEENQVLVVVDIPVIVEEESGIIYETMPLGIIHTQDYFVTVCLRDNNIIDILKTNRMREFFTFKKTRFTFQILFIIAKEFLRLLRHVDKKTDEIERNLRASMKNKELFRLLDMEKTLVFFTTSLMSNELLMERLLRGKIIKMYDEDEDLLEDVIIENKQAIEMANIHSTILSGQMDAFASVISNNLNIVMKILASITIVLAIPQMVFSMFGMNTAVPWEGSIAGFWYTSAISVVLSVSMAFILWKKDMF